MVCSGENRKKLYCRMSTIQAVGFLTFAVVSWGILLAAVASLHELFADAIERNNLSEVSLEQTRPHSIVANACAPFRVSLISAGCDSC
jgi:hypothetical protein